MIRYHGFDLCGENLGRHTGTVPECEGFNRICYGKPGHAGGHGNDGDCAELLLSDDQLQEFTHRC